VLYVDHGSDFTSKHLEQVAVDLHFEIVYSTIARPRPGQDRTSVRNPQHRTAA
jgi:transposase InsO family protein